VADDYLARIERFLSDNDIAVYRFERRGKHRAVVVTFGGRTRRFFFPTSGSDRRGPANTIANLRRELRLR
jgi:hypothetical protein